MLELSKFDMIDYLKTNEDIAYYLEAVLRQKSPKLFVAAMDNINKARKINNIPDMDLKINDKNEINPVVFKILDTFKTINEIGVKITFIPEFE